MAKKDYHNLLEEPIGNEANMLKEKLQFAIRDLGLNMISVSKAMGLDSFSVLNDFYCKNTVPNFAFFEQFCNTFGVSQKWLYDIENTDNSLPFEPSLIENGNELDFCRNAVINILIAEKYFFIIADKFGVLKFVNKNLKLDGDNIRESIDLLSSIIGVARKVILRKIYGLNFEFAAIAERSPRYYFWLGDKVGSDMMCNEHSVIQAMGEFFAEYKDDISKVLLERFANSWSGSNKEDSEAQLDIGLFSL